MKTPRSQSTNPANIPKRWVWHYQALSRLRERLLQERHGRLIEATEPIEGHSLHEADSASDEFNHNLSLSQLSSDQDALNEVEAALSRIITGHYGICELTGIRIASARLKALPWTRYCASAEADLE